MTPAARKMTRSRAGNGEPSCSVERQRQYAGQRDSAAHAGHRPGQPHAQAERLSLALAEPRREPAPMSPIQIQTKRSAIRQSVSATTVSTGWISG